MTITLDGSTGISTDTGFSCDGISFANNAPSNSLVVTSAGNVGINTSSPSKKLSVNGDIRLGDAGGTGAIFTDASNGLRIMLPAVGTSTTEAMRIDSSGNVGIGTSSPAGKLSLYGGDFYLQNSDSGQAGNDGLRVYLDTSESNSANLRLYESSAMKFYTGNVERMRIDSSGNLKFNSGYGSAATAYGCRAWVNFNGTGTPAIRASGNVSSITDNGTGDYTVNFSTAMPDTNYTVAGAVMETGSTGTTDHLLGVKRAVNVTDSMSTSQLRICVFSSSAALSDDGVVTVVVHR